MDLKLIDKKDIRELNKKLTEIKKDNELINEQWLSSEEAAEFLKVSKKTLQRYRDAGKLAYSKDGRTIRYKKLDLIKYLNRNYFSIENIKNK
jgi:excisionase family DNA binding protein